MKKVLLSILLFLPLVLNAYNFSVAGIYYSIRTYGEGNNVWVDKGDDYYEGELIIPSSVVFNETEYRVIGISFDAFKNNTRLKKVVLPESIESISNTFWGCSGLVEVLLPQSLKTIESYTFSGCSSLESIALPDQLETIGVGAFADCYSLKEVVIPQSVINITGSIIQGCPSLNIIKVEEGNPKYDSRDNCNAIIDRETLCLISGCRNTVIPSDIKAIGRDAFNGCTKLQSISIPDNVTEIGDNAFLGCTSLKTVKLPSMITIIANQMFYKCSSLESVELPSGISAIGGSAFSQCSALTSISLPQSVSQIDSYAFAYTPLQSMIIPEGITELGSGIFTECHYLSKVFLPSTLKKIGNLTFERCYSLYDIWCYAPVAPYTSTSSFESAPYKYATLHIYKSALDDYKATWPWSDFANYEFIKEGDKEQCVKPTIRYENGRVVFASETEGAEFCYDITNDDIRSGKGEEVYLTATYTISVFAAADGFEDSEVATATLCWLNAQPSTEGMMNDIAAVKGNAILIQTDEGVITVSGVKDRTNIDVYTVSGVYVGSARSFGSSASISTNLRSGEIAIVRIDDKSVKVVMK
ncbi:MAG: leucine-rich repeat domain-containing protein [Prevotella sp.]|nr:leucine-rich repeat domain-containing protein [Prevotella sp.]